MFSGIWRKVKKKNMKKERKFGLKEFPRPLNNMNGGYLVIGVQADQGIPVLPPKGLAVTELDVIL